MNYKYTTCIRCSRLHYIARYNGDVRTISSTIWLVGHKNQQSCYDNHGNTITTEL